MFLVLVLHIFKTHVLRPNFVFNKLIQSQGNIKNSNDETFNMDKLLTLQIILQVAYVNYSKKLRVYEYFKAFCIRFFNVLFVFKCLDDRYG